jgi:hypothetical protein
MGTTRLSLVSDTPGVPESFRADVRMFPRTDYCGEQACVAVVAEPSGQVTASIPGVPRDEVMIDRATPGCLKFLFYPGDHALSDLRVSLSVA